jgi:hypothetical protein
VWRSLAVFDRASNVCRVEIAERALTFTWQRLFNSPHPNRDRRSHQRAPRNQGTRHPNAGRGIVGGRRRQIEPFEDASAPPQLIRHDDARHSNQEFSQRIETKRRELKTLATLVQLPATRPRAEPQSGHEHRQHDRNHSCRHAKLGHRQAKPYQLVKDATKPGDKEERKKHPPKSLLRWMVSQAVTRAEHGNENTSVWPRQGTLSQ